MPLETTLAGPSWPPLLTPGYLATATTMRLWSQIIGKIKLSLTPPMNHMWHSALLVDAHGLTTGPLPARIGDVELELDFLAHVLHVRGSDGDARDIALIGRSVAAVYADVLAALHAFDVDVRIHAAPNEMSAATPFADDRAVRPYDAAWATDFFRALLDAHRVLTEFRARFLGKASPVHFFWGGFDLAVTRFSGRRAPRHPGGVPHLPDWVVQESYSHEVSSAGFWPGDDIFPAPAFYSYAYPEPPGFADTRLATRDGFYHPVLHEMLLPYESARRSSSPSLSVLAFLEETYDAAAALGGWDRKALERSAHDGTRRASPTTSPCAHLERAAVRALPAAPRTHGCEECLRSGGDWVHLRLCLTCGHVGCCDDSPHQHATKHFHDTRHAVIRSYEPGEDWAWCFVDEQLAPSLPTFAPEIAHEHIDPPRVVDDAHGRTVR